MGKYINVNSKGEPLDRHFKADALIKDGAVEVPEPKEWVPNLVCVVENAMFDAAGWADTEKEMKYFAQPDGRTKRWLIHPNAPDIVDKDL